ncbi:polymeric immunoglobulin receptor-like [Astyanax mexicanus]|nr:polymeric immunoglobulin receptor-like [Astyanax mexicanus]
MVTGGAADVKQLSIAKEEPTKPEQIKETTDALNQRRRRIAKYSPVGSFDVIGYPGGSLRIYCHHDQSRISKKYFCKEKTEQCTHVETLHSWKHGDRVSLVSSPTFLTVIYRDLSLEDAGLYQCGETGVWNHTVNLRVKTDPCCSGSKTLIGYPRVTTTINCSYPEEFQNYIKYFYKWDGDWVKSLIDTRYPQKGRFSISDNRKTRDVSVRIRDVVEDDGGVYYCGVGLGRNSVSFDTFFTKIHLWVSVSLVIIIIIIIIISVSICVFLLLIGGLTLIFYKLRCSKTQDSPITRRQSGTNETVYENVLAGNQNNIRMGPIYQNLKPNTNQSDSVYQSLDQRSRDPNSVYHTLHPNTNQIQSVRD